MPLPDRRSSRRIRAPGIALVAFVLFAGPEPLIAQGGVPLGPEFRVNTYTTSLQRYPAAATDSAGNFVVVWDGLGQGAYGIFGQRYSATGLPLGGEFRVSTYTGPSVASHAAVAADLAGNFVVVWERYGSIYGQRYANTGAALGAEFQVSSGTLTKGHAGVAADAAGNFVVAWYEADFLFPGPSYVYAQRYASTGSPLGGKFLVNSTTGYHRNPAVASDSSGNFVVVWENPFDVAARRFSSAGTPLGAEFRVNTNTAGTQDKPRVASDSTGDFVVVWQSGHVFGQRYAASGTPLGTEFQVNTFPAGLARPSVAADPVGNFVVAWQGSDGSGNGVSAQRYLSSGVPLGQEFRVNSYTTSFQFTPSVAADALAFVVVWTSDQDGSFGGIFGQRYSMIVPVELQGFTVE